ncbi:MAG: SAM hydrolase/SAM-dependent halogenase family protein [Coriobacteriia bacterium]
MHSIICFTSDFGTSDAWVGVCHAVIYRACPQVRVVDLAHDIPPFDIRKAAAVAAAGAWQLPEALHLVVADPGVGGGRRDLVVVTGRGTVLVGPDNGVLIPSTWRGGGIAAAYSIEPASLDFHAPLATFHARDVLARAAALLACGVEVKAVGSEVDPASLAPPPFSLSRIEGDVVVAEVIDTDRFGSMRIAVSAEEARSRGLDAGRVEIVIGHSRIEVPFGRTFSDVAEGETVALIDSSGWLTIAVNLGSAAERYGIEPGTVTRVRSVR